MYLKKLLVYHLKYTWLGPDDADADIQDRIKLLRHNQTSTVVTSAMSIFCNP